MKKILLLLFAMFAFTLSVNAMDLKNGEQLVNHTIAYSIVAADKVNLVASIEKANIEAPMMLISSMWLFKEMKKYGVVSRERGNAFPMYGKLEVGWQGDVGI